MRNNVKDIDTKSCTYYFINNIINIKNFDPNDTKIDEKSYKNIFIYYNGYVTIKNLKYVQIKYLTLAPFNESKEKIKKI